MLKIACKNLYRRTLLLAQHLIAKEAHFNTAIDVVLIVNFGGAAFDVFISRSRKFQSSTLLSETQPSSLGPEKRHFGVLVSVSPTFCLSIKVRKMFPLSHKFIKSVLLHCSVIPLSTRVHERSAEFRWSLWWKVEWNFLALYFSSVGKCNGCWSKLLFCRQAWDRDSVSNSNLAATLTVIDDKWNCDTFY